MSQLESNISSYELAEWMAMSSLEPFGAVRDDYRTGLLCATVANASGRYKKEIKPEDVIHIYKQPVIETVEQRARKVASQMALFKGLAGK